MNHLKRFILESEPVRESPHVKAGQPIQVYGLDRAIYVHPLDAVMLTQPDLTPAGRVMVLVDRVYDAAMNRVDA